MMQMDALFGPCDAASAVAEACQRFHVRRLDLFGSAATGRAFDDARVLFAAP